MVRLAVLGDSIAWGQGASRPDERLAPRLVAGLAQHRIEAIAQVFAVPGARSRGLEAQVGRAGAWRPHVTVIVIGANDLTHLEPTEVAARHLATAVRRLRDAGSEVVVAPAPDLSAVPHVPAPLRDVVRAAADDLRSLQTAAVIAAGGRVADRDHETSRAFASDRTLFAADRFHPSGAGYAVIASTLLPVVLEAAESVLS